jgi:hypothetical protein
MGSQEFSQKLFGAFEQGGANVSFIIGISFNPLYVYTNIQTYLQ